MTLVRQTGLVEVRFQQIVIRAVRIDRADDIFAPARNRIIRSPQPAFQCAIKDERGAALRSATNFNQSLPDFIGASVERREGRKFLGHFPDHEVALRIEILSDDVVSDALKGEHRTRVTNVRGGNEKIRRNRCAKKSAPCTFVLPAAVCIGAGRRCCIFVRIAAAIKNDRACTR